MLNESSEKAHQMVALGLLTRIFYASEPLGELSRYYCCGSSHALSRAVLFPSLSTAVPACLDMNASFWQLQRSPVDPTAIGFLLPSPVGLLRCLHIDVNASSLLDVA